MQTSRAGSILPRPKTAESAGPRRLSRNIFVPVLVLAALAATFSVLGATSASAISRNDVLSRAQKWVDAPVPYSQAKRHLGYRTDCSGYVSMCWRTGTSWSTRSFHAVSHRIPTASLRPGDALLKKGYHVRLFYGWLDEAHTRYVAYESGTGTVAVCRIHSIDEDLEFGYVPTRYDRVSTSPAPRNILNNGSFNSWASSWGNRADQPVWWQANGPWWQTVVTRRKDTYRSARSSAELLNPSQDPETYTELSQSAPVTPGAEYRLSAWARTGFDPAGLELHLTYLNAIGEPVAETSSTGDAAGVTSTSFRQLTVLSAAPPDAVKALASVRLAGGESTDASGGVVPGTSATVDDISLVRPQVTAGIAPSATSARRGKTVTLRGSVTPRSAIGASAVVYVQRPGSGWKRLSTTRVYASGGTGAWKDTFKFTRTMRKGTYRFKTAVPAVAGYLGSTTSVASVKLR